MLARKIKPLGVFLPLFFVFLLFSPPRSLWAQKRANPDFSIARIWLQRVATLLNNSSPHEENGLQAVDAWKKARSYQSMGRDLFYFEARLLLAGYWLDKKPRKAEESFIWPAYQALIRSLDSAEITDEQNLSSFEQRAFLWAGLALRLRQYRPLLDRYKHWPRGEQDHPVLLYAAARAAFYLGQTEQALAFAKRGEILSDSHHDLAVLGADFGPNLPAFRALLLAAGDAEAKRHIEATWRRWGESFKEALLPWAFAGYLDQNLLRRLFDQNDPWEAAVLEMMTSEKSLPDNFAPIIQQREGENLALLRRLQRNLKDEAERRKIHDFFGQYSGLLEIDDDYDGYPDERLRLLRGKPDTHWIDSDQDGQNEWIITYDEGLPLVVMLIDNRGATTVNYEKGAYPAILSLFRTEGPLFVDMTFAPGEFLWEAFDKKETFWKAAKRPDWDENQLWNAALRVFARYDDLLTQTTSEALTYLMEGYPIRAVENRYPMGQRDKPQWVRQVLYEEGFPIAGRRAYRKNPMNPEKELWELYEHYEKGKLLGLAWIPGMQGRAKYQRDWALQHLMEIRSWDINSDFWINARYFLEPLGLSEGKNVDIMQLESLDLLPWTPADWTPWEY